MYMGTLTEDGSIGDEESNMWMMIYIYIFNLLHNHLNGGGAGGPAGVF